MRSTSHARDLARRLHLVSCRRCHLRPCVHVSPLLPCVLSAAMGVAAAIHVVCGHASRRRCGCRLQPWVLSPSRVSSVAVGVAAAGCGCRRRRHPYRLRPCVLSPPPCKSLRPCALLLRATRITADAMRIVCGRECCRRRRRACRLWPCMLPLPPRVSSAAMHVAAAAARVVCGRARRRCGPCVSLLGLQYSHVIEKNKVSEKKKKKKRKHTKIFVSLCLSPLLEVQDCQHRSPGPSRRLWLCVSLGRA